MSHDLIAGVVATLHQYARPDPGDQIEWRVLFKDDDKIDRLQRRQHFGPRALVLHRTILTLEPLHRSVAVEADDQPIAGAARRGQNLDVTGMQDVETAVGEADPQ